MIESLNDGLIAVITAAGGSKVVGSLLRPELPATDAGVWLRNCLNDDRREKLSLDQFKFLLKLGREAECHEAMNFLAADVGYATTPVDPETELARVLRMVEIHNERNAATSAALTAQLARATASLASAQSRRKTRA